MQFNVRVWWCTRAAAMDTRSEVKGCKVHRMKRVDGDNQIRICKLALGKLGYGLSEHVRYRLLILAVIVKQNKPTSTRLGDHVDQKCIKTC